MDIQPFEVIADQKLVEMLQTLIDSRAYAKWKYAERASAG